MRTAKNIPNNWKEIKIEDISLKIHYGYGASSTPINTGTKLLRITDIQDYKVNWEEVPFCEIAEHEIDKYLLKDGDIVFARTGATVGKSFLIQGKIPRTVFASYLIRIQLSQIINPKYLYYFFQSADYWRQIGLKAMGIGQPNVNASLLSRITLPLAPLSEQNKIVTKIEELFSALDNNLTTLNKIEQQLDIYKQVIYDKAFNGQNAQKAKQKIKLGKVVQHISTKVLPENGAQFKFIGLDCIKSNEMSPFKLYDFSKLKSAGNYFQKDQILYGRMRPYLNKLYKAEFDGVCSGEFIVLQCNEVVIPDYLKYILHSKDFVTYAISKSSGDRPRISFSEIAEYPIPICSVDEQKSVVETIESQMSICKKIEETIIDSKEKVKVFRHTILKKAFEGSLTAKYSSTELAQNLLNEIKSERKVFIEMEKQNKEKTPKVSKAKVMTEHLKSILHLLQENKKPIATQILWQKSEFKNDIDGFYHNVKELIDSGVIKEAPRKGKESFLTLTKSK